MLHLLPSLLLSIALGLSWNRFILTFSNRGDSLQDQMPTTMIAAAVSVSALALCVADKGFLLGGAIALLGLALAAISRGLTHSAVIVGLSVASLATYLQFAGHALQ